jgi:hypothetical protein
MATFKAKIDLVKLGRDLNRELARYKREGIDGLPNADKQYIGDEVIKIMKDQISKGLSPIDGNGRFPGYKAVDGFNRAKSAARGKGRKASAAVKKKGYPYSVMHKYPGKKVRPVNLLLSGRFLDALECIASNSGVTIGFWRKPYSDYERGHREGANTQPERPIIPQGDETFTRNVYQRLLDTVRQRVIARLEKIAKS